MPSSLVRCFYSPGYFLSLPENHPFPMRKFPEAHDMLLARGALRATDIVEVGPAERCVLERVHRPAYLEKLSRGDLSPQERTILGLPPSRDLYERSAREVEGTRRAAWAALESGIGANLAGGTHHAFSDHGEGFCVLNDVAVAIRDVHVCYPRLRVFVVDTDAHQGNGTHHIFAGDENVFTYSIHVGANYPFRKVPGSLDVPLDRFANGVSFLKRLAQTLPIAVEGFRPELAFWISGADPHRNDRFGQLQLTARDMAARDRLVLDFFLSRGIPIVVLYGGGYNREPLNTARLHCSTIIEAIRMSGSAPTNSNLHP